MHQFDASSRRSVKNGVAYRLSLLIVTLPSASDSLVGLLHRAMGNCAGSVTANHMPRCGPVFSIIQPNLPLRSEPRSSSYALPECKCSFRQESKSVGPLCPVSAKGGGGGFQ